MMEQLSTIQLFAVWILPVIFAVTLHEVSHGLVAFLFGDKTAFILGRLSLNPIKHIDLIGTIIIPGLLLLLGGFVFGWAKPVPINERNLPNPRRDMAIIALAGPVANLIMAFAWAAIAKLGVFLMQRGVSHMLAIVYMGKAGVTINLVLMILNLLPLPPLDGGHVLMGLLPKVAAMKIARIAPYGFFILLLMLATGILSVIINPVLMVMYGTITNLFGV